MMTQQCERLKTQHGAMWQVTELEGGFNGPGSASHDEKWSVRVCLAVVMP